MTTTGKDVVLSSCSHKSIQHLNWDRSHPDIIARVFCLSPFSSSPKVSWLMSYERAPYIKGCNQAQDTTKSNAPLRTDAQHITKGGNIISPSQQEVLRWPLINEFIHAVLSGPLWWYPLLCYKALLIKHQIPAHMFYGYGELKQWL